MITCPSCGATVPDLDRCAACDYPMILRRAEAAPTQPGAPSSGAAPPFGAPPSSGAAPSFGAGGPDPYGTNPFSSPPAAAASQDAGYQAGGYLPFGSEDVVACPNSACRHANPSRRTLCERCGWYLRPQPGAEPEPPAWTATLPAAQPQRRSRATPVVLAVVAALLVGSLAFASYGLFSGGGSDEPPPTARSEPTDSPAAAPETYVVDAGDVTAEASSVQKAAGSVTYGAANLLDGDPRTAWNSNGDKVGDGEGVTLTFTFAEPVDLKGIALLNGYQKKIKDGGKTKDLFKANGRVAGLTVTTDSGETAWEVGDARAAQKLDQDLGETSTVTLTVTGVHPGAEYEDLALSEVSFLAQR